MSEQDDFITLLQDPALNEDNSGDAQAPLVKFEQDKIPAVPKSMDSLTAKIRQEAAQRDVSKDLEGPSSAFVHMVEPNEVLEYRKSGVQPYMVRKLRNGEYREADFIDLHGSTIEQAYEKVVGFIKFALEHEYRCVLIVHGKGEYSKPKALLKSYTAHWLRQMEEVLAFHSAPGFKGGVGAVLVILKKSERSSAQNRERFARR